MIINHFDFLDQPNEDYTNQLQRECSSHSALPDISYVYETEKKTQTVAERIFSSFYSLVSLPYQFIHWITGLCIKIPTCDLPEEAFTEKRIDLDPEYDQGGIRKFYQDTCQYSPEQIPSRPETWKYKRISIAMDGSTIDAMLIVRKSLANNGTWILQSNAGSDFYELHRAYTTCTKKLALSLNANILIFNYPGVGATKGNYTRKTIAKTYQAMLRFLENKEKGIGARTIIGLGYCFGGNVQGEALKDYELQKDINYVFIKDRSASELSKAASHVTYIWEGIHLKLSWIGKILELCGWNMDTLSSSKQLLNAHEVLLHTGAVETARLILNPDFLIDDGLLRKEETLGYHILKNQNCSSPKKLVKTKVIAIPENHDDSLSSDTFCVLRDTIRGILESRRGNL